MAIRRQTFFVWRWFQAGFFFLTAVLALTGCAADSTNPIAVENLNGLPPKQESLAMELDCRGIVNGSVFPGGGEPQDYYAHPLHFDGEWSMKYMGKSNWYMATCDSKNARIDVVATMSRVIFDFWDYELYENPGRVSFYIDEKKLGTFELARSAADGQKFMYYQITTQKNTVATVSMVLETGRVTVMGVKLTSLDRNYPY